MILYKGGYKYQLVEEYSCVVSILPEQTIYDGYVVLDTRGNLNIRKGYAWDGPSGPTIDTSTFMRGSLVHDALYQLIRAGKLDSSHREQADKELRRICLEDGMYRIRAWWVYQAVRNHGASAADPKNRKKVYKAP